MKGVSHSTRRTGRQSPILLRQPAALGLYGADDRAAAISPRPFVFSPLCRGAKPR